MSVALNSENFAAEVLESKMPVFVYLCFLVRRMRIADPDNRRAGI